MKTGESLALTRFRKDSERTWKPLTHADHLELHKKFHETGDTKYRDRLVESLVPFVWFIANRYSRLQADMEDVIAEGCLSMVRAVEGWNPEKCGLTTWVSYTIRRDIIRNAIGNGMLPVKVPTGEEGKSIRRVELDRLVDEDQGFIVDNLVGHCEQDSEPLLQYENDRLIYDMLRDRLSDLDFEVIVRAYGLLGYERESQREIAEKWDRSPQYVCNHVNTALKALDDPVVKTALCSLNEVETLRPTRSYEEPHPALGMMPSSDIANTTRGSARPVMIEGTYYDTVAAAARAYSVTRERVEGWIDAGKAELLRVEA